MIKLFDEYPELENDRILLRRLTDADVEALGAFTGNELVYRTLPTFLYERKYPDPHEVIRRMHEECFVTKESLILGLFLKSGEEFCGLAEFYGYKDSLHKVCIGNRFSERCWGKGIATQTVSLMTDYLFTRTDIEIITASSMTENRAAGRVLEKSGFTRTASGVPEDWGYEQPVLVDKWFL